MIQGGESVVSLFLKINLSTTISMKRSRRKLSNDMAEHRPILKRKGVVHIFQDGKNTSANAASASP